MNRALIDSKKLEEQRKQQEYEHQRRLEERIKETEFKMELDERIKKEVQEKAIEKSKQLQQLQTQWLRVQSETEVKRHNKKQKIPDEFNDTDQDDDSHFESRLSPRDSYDEKDIPQDVNDEFADNIIDDSPAKLIKKRIYDSDEESF